MNPRPVPLGLCVARMGSVMPLPSGPRPMPGLQPMVCNMRLPMLLSGMGGAFSPTTPEKTEVTDKQEGVFTVFMSVNIIAFHPKATPADS